MPITNPAWKLKPGWYMVAKCSHITRSELSLSLRQMRGDRLS